MRARHSRTGVLFTARHGKDIFGTSQDTYRRVFAAVGYGKKGQSFLLLVADKGLVKVFHARHPAWRERHRLLVKLGALFPRDFFGFLAAGGGGGFLVLVRGVRAILEDGKSWHGCNEKLKRDYREREERVELVQETGDLIACCW